MLKTRILTAAIVLLLFLAALFYFSANFWAGLLLVLVAIGAWEWAKLAKFSAADSAIYLGLTMLLGGGLLTVLSEAARVYPYTTVLLWIYAASLVFWVGVVPFLLKSKRPIKNPILLAFAGWLLLLPTCLALYQLRVISPLLLLGFMAAIWISDTAAYFTGRAFGKRKLAPGISPGKTWEGVAGALVAVFVYALAWNFFAGDKARLLLLVPLLLGLAVLGIVGDLFESLMKRHAGVKDSGNILPGHGGILDRIDALTSTLPAAVLALLVFTMTAP